MDYIHQAIYELHPNVKSIMKNENDEYSYMDKDGNIIEVNVDWNTVNTKATELQTAHDNEQETKKNNKVSAYRKMDMTDDEILAIDPTLEEYL